MTLSPGEFIRRVLIHVLPKGLHRIRHYGLLAASTKAEMLAKARALLGAVAPEPESEDNDATTDERPCPCCGGPMRVIETFEPGYQPRHRPTVTPVVMRIDTS